MEPFIIILFAPVVFGGIVGWFARGRITPTVMICVGLSLIILAAGMISSASSDGITWQNWPQALFYDFIPYLIFILTPCLIGGMIGSALARYVKRRKIRQML